MRRSADAGAAAAGSSALARSWPSGARTATAPPNSQACPTSNAEMLSVDTMKVITVIPAMPATGPSYGFRAPDPTR